MKPTYIAPYRPAARYSNHSPFPKKSRSGVILWVGFWACLAVINLTVMLKFWPSDSTAFTQFHFGSRPALEVSPVRSALELAQSLQIPRPKSPPAPSAKNREKEETLTAWFDAAQR